MLMDCVITSSTRTTTLYQLTLAHHRGSTPPQHLLCTSCVPWCSNGDFAIVDATHTALNDAQLAARSNAVTRELAQQREMYM